eukprot:Gb_32572 [translate_table: standard]
MYATELLARIWAYTRPPPEKTEENVHGLGKGFTMAMPLNMLSMAVLYCQTVIRRQSSPMPWQLQPFLHTLQPDSTTVPLDISEEDVSKHEQMINDAMLLNNVLNFTSTFRSWSTSPPFLCIHNNQGLKIVGMELIVSQDNNVVEAKSLGETVGEGFNPVQASHQQTCKRIFTPGAGARSEYSHDKCTPIAEEHLPPLLSPVPRILVVSSLPGEAFMEGHMSNPAEESLKHEKIPLQGLASLRFLPDFQADLLQVTPKLKLAALSESVCFEDMLYKIEWKSTSSDAGRVCMTKEPEGIAWPNLIMVAVSWAREGHLALHSFSEKL